MGDWRRDCPSPQPSPRGRGGQSPLLAGTEDVSGLSHLHKNATAYILLAKHIFTLFSRRKSFLGCLYGCLWISSGDSGMRIGRHLDRVWIGLQRAAGGRGRAWYIRLATWLDRRQYERARHKPERAFLFQFLAGVTATLIFSLTGCCIWLAAHLLWSPWPSLQLAGLGLGVLSVWLAYPRLLSAPPQAVQVDATTLPTLHHVVATLAALLQVTPPVVVLTEQLGLAFGRIGWQRQPILLLGHPLLLILEPQEIVAVIAHELAHDRDGAATRSLFLLLALNSAGQWRRLLRPRLYQPAAASSRGQRWRGQALRALSWLWRPGYWLTTGLYNALQFCMARDAQQAEYAVDRLAATVVGVVDMPGLMHKFLYGHAPQVRTAYIRARPACKATALACAVRRTPAPTVARLWAEVLAQPRALTEWHPPLTYRLAALEQLVPLRPKIQLSPAQVQALHHELQLWPILIDQRAAYWLNTASLPQTEPALAAEILRPINALRSP